MVRGSGPLRVGAVRGCARRARAARAPLGLRRRCGRVGGERKYGSRGGRPRGRCRILGAVPFHSAPAAKQHEALVACASFRFFCMRAQMGRRRADSMGEIHIWTWKPGGWGREGRPYPGRISGCLRATPPAGIIIIVLLRLRRSRVEQRLSRRPGRRAQNMNSSGWGAGSLLVQSGPVQA